MLVPTNNLKFFMKVSSDGNTPIHKMRMSGGYSEDYVLKQLWVSDGKSEAPEPDEWRNIEIE